MKTVLLTGFEPFGGHAANPSQHVATQLDGVVMREHRVIGATLACQFGKSIRQLRKLIATHQPALVICLGLAGGRAEITPERVAINIDDARIPDNAGRQPIDRPVVRGGPAAYWSTLPVKAIVSELHRHDLPASVSQTAGTFVCNHVFYGLMHELAQTPDIRGGFIHLPFQREPDGPEPALSADQLVAAAVLAITTALRVKRDVRTAGGTTH